jgi:hypothetical protein
MQIPTRFFMLVLALLLGACAGPDSTPPAVSISSPALGQGVSGTVLVQLSARDDSGIAKISLYGRSRNSTAQGVFLGSASVEPFVVSWATGIVPNQAEIELYAKAEDTSGNFGLSDPIWVKINTAGAPALGQLIAYTLPTGSQATRMQLLSLQQERPPLNWSPAPKPTSQSNPPALYALQYLWNAVPGAQGYRLWQSDNLVGPYQNVHNQLPDGNSLQFYNMALNSAKPGDALYGSLTVTINSSESTFSNATQTVLLPLQQVLSPSPNTVATTKPKLRWQATAGAEGYLFFLSRKPQETAGVADWLCSSINTSSDGKSLESTDKLEQDYPASCPVLTPGAYYWWVQGIRFSSQGLPVAKTLSPSVAFLVE